MFFLIQKFLACVHPILSCSILANVFCLANWSFEFGEIFVWTISTNKTFVCRETFFNHFSLIHVIVVYFLFRLFGNDWEMTNYPCRL